MTAIDSFPPDASTVQYGQRVLPDRRYTPGVVGALDGTAQGPEHAGALSLVYGSFASDEGAQNAYRHFTDAQHAMQTTEGFIRWFSFNDGPHGYGLGLWRAADDAVAFARSAVHQSMVRDQRTAPFELGQFAGIWTAHTIGRHLLNCTSCGTASPASSSSCPRCGQDISDGFS